MIWTHYNTQLKEVVGPDFFTSEPCNRLVYSKDYSIEDFAGDYTPGVVVKHGSSDETAEIVRIANEQNIPLHTWGGGTSMSGNPLAAILLGSYPQDYLVDIVPETRSLECPLPVGHGILLAYTRPV